MSCLSALHSQIVTFFSVPHEILLLQHKVFREYAKVALGPDFIHTLPSLILLAAMLLVLWKNPPHFGWLAHTLGLDLAYKTLQVSVSWVLINAGLWLWLIFQRILYCCVWSHWNHGSEHGESSQAWWQRVWSSYYPAPLQPSILSAGLISWIISMAIANGILGCAISATRMRLLAEDSLAVLQDLVLSALRSAKRSVKRLRETALSGEKKVSAGEDCSEVSSICDDLRSELSLEASNLGNLEVRPISYGTNWMPRPKEPKKKMSLKSLHTVTGANVLRESELSPRQLRHRRGCRTVIPRNSSDKSSGC